MEKLTNERKRSLYIGIVVIALGVVLTANIQQKFGSLGLVFVGIGGLLFITSMRKGKKRKEDE